MFAIENEQLSLFEERRLQAPLLHDADIVRTLCRELIAEAGLKPPVPVEVVASFRGVGLIRRADIEAAAMLSREGGRFVIRVRESDGWERQRFSVLHEAGHTYLPGFADRTSYRCNPSRSRDRIEQLCDIAAAELLFPYPSFRADVIARTLDLVTVEELATRYQGSIESTALRLAELADRPVALVVLAEGLKPSQIKAGGTDEPAIRVLYSRAIGNWPYVPRHKSVPADGPLGRAFEGEVIDEIASLAEPFVTPLETVHISARRYGRRVLALIRAA